MNAQFYAFGEILWDCLPSGRHAGGAPFNVAAHLTQLGVPAALISSVGLDPLGDEILAVARDKNVDARFVTRARIGLATGKVIATVDANGNATYELVQPSAWDEIIVPADALEAVAHGKAFVFGSLAGRSPYNREQLERLLSLAGPLKFFDVNLRAPFVDPDRILALAARADVIKLNDDEIGQLVTWLNSGKMAPNRPESPEAVGKACAAFSDRTGARRICVTMGPSGAALWQADAPLVHVPAPPTVVEDTVGAGDAFMAGLMTGLTRGVDPKVTLECACRLGAYVASHAGATPLLPPEIIAEMTDRLQLHSA